MSLLFPIFFWSRAQCSSWVLCQRVLFARWLSSSSTQLKIQRKLEISVTASVASKEVPFGKVIWPLQKNCARFQWPILRLLLKQIREKGCFEPFLRHVFFYSFSSSFGACSCVFFVVRHSPYRHRQHTLLWDSLLIPNWDSLLVLSQPLSCAKSRKSSG